jgi:predicted porin
MAEGAAEENVSDDKLLGGIIKETLQQYDFCNNLSFSGDGNLMSAFTDQDSAGDRESSTVSYEGSLGMKYSGKASGFGYGAEVVTKQKSGLLKRGGAIVETAYLFLEFDRIGAIKIGHVKTAANIYSIYGDAVLVGYQGPGSGNLGAFYNVSAGSLIYTGFSGDDSRAFKFLWQSPVMSGFSVALSFTPNSKNANLFRRKHHTSEDAVLDSSWDFAHTSGFSKNILTGGISYECGSSDAFNGKIALSGWIGKGVAGSREIGMDNQASVENIAAYNIGLILGYKDFKIAAGFTSNCKSLLAEDYATEPTPHFEENMHYNIVTLPVGIMPGADAGRMYSFGAAYKIGDWSVSAGYYRSDVRYSTVDEKATADIITLAAEYKVNKSMSWYCEYNYINTKTCDRARVYAEACDLAHAGNNRANIFMVGCKIKI